MQEHLQFSPNIPHRSRAQTPRECNVELQRTVEVDAHLQEGGAVALDLTSDTSRYLGMSLIVSDSR